MRCVGGTWLEECVSERGGRSSKLDSAGRSSHMLWADCLLGRSRKSGCQMVGGFPWVDCRDKERHASPAHLSILHLSTSADVHTHPIARSLELLIFLMFSVLTCMAGDLSASGRDLRATLVFPLVSLGGSSGMAGLSLSPTG